MNWNPFKRTPKAAIAEPEPEPPFTVGQVTDLIKGQIDFEVVSICKSSYSGDWEIRGNAIVHLPADSVAGPITPIADKEGKIRSFAISYLELGKENVIPLSRNWYSNPDETTTVYVITIDRVGFE